MFVSGEFTIKDATGQEYVTKKGCSLCRCGLSNNKPFCDGTHKGVFKDESRAPNPP
ncbi:MULTISPECIES: CDGSH iron-sulfur domain-containing protein [Pontibacillus]|uniref:CDGSH iron-sulfur domain-containing protein n=1 Tax=Pontibacillus TaxID=289201 RepID=UPI002102B40D|nr:CDGSH iron-sulfur domain-containing protein [Pontibacillus sp. HN14]